MASDEAGVMEAFLHRSVPLTAYMGVRVVRLDAARVELTAPLEVNRNHFGGAFGGSVANLGLAAAWLLIHWQVMDREPAPTVVIAEQRVTYERPITGPLWACAAMPESAAWEAFQRALDHRGRGRIAMAATVAGNADTAARFEGTFVALGADAGGNKWL